MMIANIASVNALSLSLFTFQQPLLLHIDKLDVVAQIIEHINKDLIDDTLFLVYWPTIIRCGGANDLRQLYLCDTFFQTFYSYKDLDLYPQPPLNTRSSTLNSEEPLIR